MARFGGIDEVIDSLDLQAAEFLSEGLGSENWRGRYNVLPIFKICFGCMVTALIHRSPALRRSGKYAGNSDLGPRDIV